MSIVNRLSLALGFFVLAACESPEPELPAWVGDAGAWPELRSPVPRDPAIEARIDQLMAEMSLEQKVGQMIQAEIRWVTPRQVRDYHIGSILNGGGGFPNENKQSTVEDWVALADAFYEASMDTSEGGLPIPVLWGTDSVHGVNNVIGATLFPHNIGLGAARNPDLVRRIGEVTAIETAVIGIPWTFAPTLAVVRDDRWGRTYEGYSEDPQLVRSYAAKIVEGLQGRLGSDEYLDDAHVLATAKHFLGDGGTERGVDQGDNLATDEELFNVHGQGYVSALAAGARAVMVSYSRSRGHRMHGNHFLLTEMLKGKMDFDGVVLGDWNGHSQLPGCSKKSCPAAINAGIDLVMAPDKWKSFYKNTLRQARDGDIPIARIDDAVRRILRVKFEAGLFESGSPSSRALAGKTEFLGSAGHRAVARQAVRESLVLLKNNDRLLPLRRDQSVLVAGAGANDVGRQSGGWTLTWQGTDNTADDFPGATSIFEGIAMAVSMGGGRATLSEDGSYTQKPDVAIVVWGETPYAECAGDRQHLNFAVDDPGTLALLEGLSDEGIPVVSVFLSGRPLWVNPQLNASTAFVAAWLPGSEGAGIADVLFRNADGLVNHDFTGRLSYSWPASTDQLVLNAGDEQYEPLFPFGYGLTYADNANVSNQLSTDIGDERFGRMTRIKRTSCVED
jgi:beta-glucosidase